MDEHNAPTRTPVNPLRERILRWISGSGRGQAFGHLLSRVIALPQLGRLTASEIPWTPLSLPISEATVAIGRVADEHFGFGLSASAKALIAPGREVARRLAQAHVDLVLLVPA